MSADEPEPELSFTIGGELSPELVRAMLGTMTPDGGRVVELDPPGNGSGTHVFVAVSGDSELSHEDRVGIYNFLLARQDGGEQ